MIVNFEEAIAALGANAAVTVANAARPPANYLFNTFLPERPQPDYHVEAANMIVRSTMAGLVAMDSPYPPAGSVEISTFLMNSAKFGIETTLTEGAIRQLQALMRVMRDTGTLSNDFLQREALNFLQKVIIQGQLDVAEWLRGQALIFGKIDWTFNQKNLLVDYGYTNAHNFLPTRTDASNDAYGDTNSAFWTDVATARSRLAAYGGFRAVVMNSVTADAIISNPANSLELLAQSSGGMTLRRYRTIGGNTVPDTDQRFQVSFVTYDEEVEVLDTTQATLGRTQTIKLIPNGKVMFVAGNRDRGYRVGTGSTDDPENDLELGFHAVAPTVEGGGVPGRWARLFTPEAFPMQLKGQGASNELPVILAPEKVIIATTELL